MTRLSEDRCLCLDHVVDRSKPIEPCPIHSATYSSTPGTWLNRLFARKPKRRQ